jgi:hypothetical protein
MIALSNSVATIFLSLDLADCSYSMYDQNASREFDVSA